MRRLATAELEFGPTYAAMQSVATQWLASRRMAPMGFLVRFEWSAGFPSGQGGFVSLLDAVTAFVTGGFMPFGARSLLKSVPSTRAS